jgi:hypothetical protein
VVRHRRLNFELEALERRQLLSAGFDPTGAPSLSGPSGGSIVAAARGSFGAFDSAEDVGAPAQPGATLYDNGTYTITAGGADIGGTSDQFHFAYNSWDADGSIVARVASLANTNAAAKAGLMFRSGTPAGAAFVGVFVTPGVGLTLLTRPTDGAATGQSTLFGFPAPRFLKLTRAGDQLTAFHSPNGVTWTQIGSPQTVALGADPLVGLAVTSRNASATTTATFTNVSVLLPLNYNDNDVGAPALPGFAVHDPASNTFVVSGGGTGVGGASDQFNFANHNVTGDGSIAALVHDSGGSRGRDVSRRPLERREVRQRRARAGRHAGLPVARHDRFGGALDLRRERRGPGLAADHADGRRVPRRLFDERHAVDAGRRQPGRRDDQRDRAGRRVRDVG